MVVKKLEGVEEGIEGGEERARSPVFLREAPGRGIQPPSISGPQWGKKSCLEPHIKYTNTNENKKIS